MGSEWHLETVEDGFDLHFAGRLVVRHRVDCPAVVIACGSPSVEMVRGNFRIDDAPYDQAPQTDWTAGEAWIDFAGARLAWAGNRLILSAHSPDNDRLWLHFHAEPGEAVWGGGEQMSYLALNGRRFPMWTSEPGVGRDKATELTRRMDAEGMAGGDFWNTNYPQPTFLTSRWLAVHL